MQSAQLCSTRHASSLLCMQSRQSCLTCHYVMQMSPFLSPLDKELVKVILKLLRSSAFLGTAQLLAAIASTDPDTRVPVGLLKVGAAVHGWPCCLSLFPTCCCLCCFCMYIKGPHCMHWQRCMRDSKTRVCGILL